MKIFNNEKAQKAICHTALHYGKSEDEVRQEMQIALDSAWDTSDPEAKRFQTEIFPDGKPSLEEFIAKLAEMAKQ